MARRRLHLHEERREDAATNSIDNWQTFPDKHVCGLSLVAHRRGADYEVARHCVGGYLGQIMINKSSAASSMTSKGWEEDKTRKEELDNLIFSLLIVQLPPSELGSVSTHSKSTQGDIHCSTLVSYQLVTMATSRQC